MTFFDVLSSNLWLFATVAAVIGLIIGSFLNVVIYRLPKMMEADWRQQCKELLGECSEEAEPAERFDLMFPGSHCPHCKQAIPFWRNIPLISYLIQRGRCANCNASISLRYPLVELLTAVLTVLVAIKFGFGWQALAAFVLTWVLIALALIDYDTQLLPDSMTMPMIWLGLLLSLLPLFVDSTSSIVGAALGYMLLWSVFHLFKLITGKEGMGFGDFKLLAMLGAWLGWKMIPLIILLSSFAGAVIGILLVVFKGHNKEKPIPFGPYLAIAGWCALMFGENLVQYYLGLTI